MSKQNKEETTFQVRDLRERLNRAIKKKSELNNRIMKAIEYGKECVNKDLDLDTLNEPYRSVFTACYEIHERYEKILKGEEK